jgi:hypothetical protein
MSAGKRPVSLTESVVISVAGNKKKKVYLKLKKPDLFYGNRKKFKAYYTQMRLCLWADVKRKKKTLITVLEQVMWAASFLRKDIYARFEPYISYYLDKDFIFMCDKPVRKVLTGDVGSYLKFLSQFYDDLDEVRISEFRLLKLI